jgi:hypothetical protein
MILTCSLCIDWVFGFSYEGAHDAGRDIEAWARAFFKLLAAGHFRL